MSQSSLQQSQKTNSNSLNYVNMSKQQLIDLYNQQSLMTSQLSFKYEKALKQMASIVKANQSLKHQFDQMQNQKNSFIQKKLKESQQQIQTYYKEIVNKKDTDIQTVTTQNKELKIKINTLEMTNKQFQIKQKEFQIQQNSLTNDKNSIEIQYESVKKQLQGMHLLLQNNQQQKAKLKLVRQQKNQINQLNKLNISLKQQVSQLQRLIKEKQKQNENLNLKIRQLQTQSVDYRSSQKKGIDTVYQQNRKLVKEISSLRLENANLTTQFQKSKIKTFAFQNLKNSRPQKEPQNNQEGLNFSEQKNIFQIMKELHDQLTPLRKELIQMKRSHSQTIIKIAKQRSEFQIDIIKKQKQLALMKQHIQMLKQKNQQLQKQKYEKYDFKQKYQRILQEKNMLQGKVIVLQTMSMTQNRKNIHSTLNKKDKQNYLILKEFQRRMELLLEDNPQNKLILQSALSMKNKTLSQAVQSTSTSLQQFIAMKAFMIDLDSKIDHLERQNEYLIKKYKSAKEKIHQFHDNHNAMQNEYQKKVKVYKEKIYSYDRLVQKLTNQLEKNINTNLSTNAINSNLKASMSSRIIKNEHDYNSIVNLYEKKMLEMGDQMLRLRKQKQSIMDKYKEQSFLMNKNIREHNDSIRQISNIREQNQKIKTHLENVEKQLFQFKVIKKLQQEFESKNNVLKESTNSKDVLQKSRVMAMLQDQNKLIRLRLQEQLKSTKNMYEKQVSAMKENIFEMERKNNELLFAKEKLQEKINALNNASNSNIAPENIHKYELEMMLKKIQELQKNLAQHSKAVSNQVVQKSSEVSQKVETNNISSTAAVQGLLKIQLERQKTYWQRQIQNLKNQTSGQKQKLWMEKQQKDRKILELQKKIKDYQLIVYQKENEISQLFNQMQQNKLKQFNNGSHSNVHESYHQYSENQSISQIYGLPQEQVKHLKIQMNNLSNKNFQQNLKISSLQAIIFNQKLEISRLQSSTEALQQKFRNINNQHYQKGAIIYELEAQLRSIRNMHDSELMAKQSLLRSYQIQIGGLKNMLQNLKSNSKNVKFAGNFSPIKESIKESSQINIESSSSLGQHHSQQQETIYQQRQQINRLSQQLMIKQSKIQDLEMKLLQKLKQKQIAQQRHDYYKEKEKEEEQDDQFLFQLSQNKINSNVKHLRNRNNNQNISQAEVQGGKLNFNVNMSPKKSPSPKTLTLIKEGQQLSVSNSNIHNQDLVINSSTKIDNNRMDINTNNLQDVSISGSPSKKHRYQWNYSNNENQQSYQEMISQIYKLKSMIISLKDQIQLKQSKNNELRHQIYNMNLLLMKQRATYSQKQRQTQRERQSNSINNINQKGQTQVNANTSQNENKIVNANQNSQQIQKQIEYLQNQYKISYHQLDNMSKRNQELVLMISQLQAQIQSLRLQLQQKVLTIQVQYQEIQVLNLTVEKLKLSQSNNNNTKTTTIQNNQSQLSQKQIQISNKLNIKNSRFVQFGDGNTNLMRYSHNFAEYEDANFDMIKQLDCTHQHIVRIEELMVQFDKLWMLRANKQLGMPPLAKQQILINQTQRQRQQNSNIRNGQYYNFGSPISQFKSQDLKASIEKKQTSNNNSRFKEAQINMRLNNYRQVESRIQDNVKGVSISMSMSSPSSLNNYPESYNQYYYNPTYNVSPQGNGSNLNYYGSNQSQNETRQYYYQNPLDSQDYNRNLNNIRYQNLNADNRSQNQYYNYDLSQKSSTGEMIPQHSQNSNILYKSSSDGIFSSTLASKQYDQTSNVYGYNLSSSNQNNHTNINAYTYNTVRSSNANIINQMGNASYTDYNPSVITDNSSRSQNLSFLRTNVERIGSISAKKI